MNNTFGKSSSGEFIVRSDLNLMDGMRWGDEGGGRFIIKDNTHRRNLIDDETIASVMIASRNGLGKELIL